MTGNDGRYTRLLKIKVKGPLNGTSKTIFLCLVSLFITLRWWVV